MSPGTIRDSIGARAYSFLSRHADQFSDRHALNVRKMLRLKKTHSAVTNSIIAWPTGVPCLEALT
jgi:hypothetical protein